MRVQPVILHLSADYPNAYRNRTTAVVRNLVEATPGFAHVVISLKREANPRRTYLHEEAACAPVRLFAFGYWGLPFGAAHLASMWLAARRIRALLAQRNLRPDLIHAHKLTFEGVMAWFLSRWLNVPYVVSLRGEAETKIVRFKPTYRPLIRRVAHGAQAIFGVSMWFVPELSRIAPGIAEKIRPLPNLGPLAGAAAVPAPQPPRFVAILDLNVYRKKGFHWLVPAFARAASKHPDWTLDVIGWSGERIMREAKALVARAGCEGRVRFLGALPHAQVLAALPDYTALLLPSVNETFGMVYLEALFAGVPVLYTAGTGIDGHLDGLNAGVKVRAGNIADIAGGIRELAATAAQRKAELARRRAELQARFGKEAIVSRYRDALCRAIAGSGQGIMPSGEEEEIREQDFPFRTGDAGERFAGSAARDADQRAAFQPVRTIAEIGKE